MVKIHYCPKCKKATREHFLRKIYCRVCKSEYEIINVSRSRYFIVQFIFLIVGFVFLFSAFLFIDPRERIYESMGVAFMGISMWLFTLLFQMMDSKDMEGRAEQKVMDREKEDEDEGIGRFPSRTTPESLKTERERLRGFREPPVSAKPGREEEPRVVRIRRALPREPVKADEPPRVPPRTAMPSKPIVIRDMSQLFEEEDDDD
jgi:hypothetical protein